MGLDFNNADAHWSYSGFNQFREKLAKQIGIVLKEMQGFAEDSGRLGKSWDTVKDDIKPLLNHSDCDGKLTVTEMKKVSPRLRELVKDWPDKDYDKGQALALCDGMDECIAFKEPLVFC